MIGHLGWDGAMCLALVLALSFVRASLDWRSVAIQGGVIGSR